MATKAQGKTERLVTLDKQAYDAAPAPSREAIRAALKKGSEDLRTASSQPRSAKIDPKRRFR